MKCLPLFVLLFSLINAQPPPLDDDNLERMIWAARLSRSSAFPGAAAQEEPFHPQYFRYIEDKVNAILLGFRLDRCFVSFKANAGEFESFWQLLKPFDKEICQRNDSSQCCKTRSGNFEAYTKPAIYDEFQTAVQECTAFCSDPDECLILLGLSQGASLAIVAGIDLIDLNPRVYTFGAVTGLDKKCKALDDERHLHFVNTGVCDCFGKETYLYDDPNEISLRRGETQRGYVLQMGDDPAFLNLGKNPKKPKQPFFHRVFNYAIHQVGFREACGVPSTRRRLEDIRSYYNRGGEPDDDPVSYPVRENGWRTGFPCNHDNECVSRNCVNTGLFKNKIGECE